MSKEQIEQLRYSSRKVVRELGIIQLDQANSNESPSCCHALIEVSKNPGITITKLGNLLLMSSSTISRLIKNLIKEELVELKLGRDKREKDIYLTAKGEKLVAKIDEYSRIKIRGAFEFLNDKQTLQLINAMENYANALEKSNAMKRQVKIVTLSTSRAIRKQIMAMVANIQINEFQIDVSDEINMCILKAEQHFYYNQSYNFWYAIDNNGKIIGSIGLKKIDQQNAEIKKFFVTSEYRGKGVAQKLMHYLVKASLKHNFHNLYLGTVDKLHAAHKFYSKYGFTNIEKNMLPDKFEICLVDTLFFKGKTAELISNIVHGKSNFLMD